MLKTILFDLDGTLIPFVQDDFIRAYFKHLVARIAPMGYDGEKIIAALWKGTGAMLKNDGTATNRQAFWDRFAQELGIGALALEGILDDFYTQEFNKVRETLKETVDRSSMIRSLREKGYTLVLATNPIFPAVAVQTRMSWVGLTSEDFDYITTYENSRFCKPRAEYYSEVAEKIGVSPEECLMVGNDVGDDMPAMNLGMRVFLLTDCLINTKNEDISAYPHGDFDALFDFINKII